MQGSAPITGLSESSSESEDYEADHADNQDLMDLSKMESLYLTGILDELKMCFNYSPEVSIGENYQGHFFLKSSDSTDMYNMLSTLSSMIKVLLRHF